MDEKCVCKFLLTDFSLDIRNLRWLRCRQEKVANFPNKKINIFETTIKFIAKKLMFYAMDDFF